VGLQAAISLLWSLLALGLLAFSRRRATRLAWNIGSGLLALTTAKLLVLDLAAAGTLARVVSFVGVGFLFLLVAFLMPAPRACSTSRSACFSQSPARFATVPPARV
jgi:uncharacterized membrane protein